MKISKQGLLKKKPMILNLRRLKSSLPPKCCWTKIMPTLRKVSMLMRTKRLNEIFYGLSNSN